MTGRRHRIALFLLTLGALLAFAGSAQAQSSANTTFLTVTTTTPSIVERTGGPQAEAVFVVRRTGNRAQTIRFGYGDCCGNTASGYDHETVGGNIGWDGSGDDDGDGNAETYTVRVDIGNDADVETDETFALEINPIEGDVQIEGGPAHVKIVDDDGRPAGTVIDVGDPSPLTEGAADTGSKQVVFPLTLSNAGTVPMTIHYATANGSAAAGEDYRETSGNVTFAPGERTKSVPVDVFGDDNFESDESFRLVLSNPTAAGPGREGTATIVNDDAEPAPPPPPPPGPPSEHTLLGVASYEPAFGVGFKGLEVLGPFAALPSPRSLTIRLRGPDGLVRREQPVTGGAVVAAGTGPVPYRFDGLPECAGCVLELYGDSTFQDSQPVSFDGEAGQTDVDLFYGRPRQGGVLEGDVVAPVGAGAGDLTVAVLDSTGKVLADTSRAPFRCDRAVCPSAVTYPYRLTGLPLAAVPVRVVLSQSSASKRLIPVDSADLTLDPGGATHAPDLNAISDPPASASGRTVYGQINFRRPFAPGAHKPSDLDLTERELKGLEVELRGPDGSVRKRLRAFTTTGAGYTGYELNKLDECSGCTVALVDNKRVAARLPVTIPRSTPSVVRRDLDVARDGDPEFLGGTILAGRTNARRMEVQVSDAATGARLATSSEGERACSGDARCQTGGTMIYRIGKVPPDRDVVVTLIADRKQVDSRRLRTSPAGEITEAPPLVVPFGKGPRSLQGRVQNGAQFGPGREPLEWTRALSVTARLLDSNGTEVAKSEARIGHADGRAASDSYIIDNLQPCGGCMLELSDRDGVQDRVPVDVRADSPSVTVADVRWKALTGGAYLEGEIIPRNPISPSTVRIQVLSASNKVLADSAKITDAKGSGEARPDSFRYRLGGIPRDAGKVKIVVLSGKLKRVASTTVTIAPGAADTTVPKLKIDVRGDGSR